MFIQSVIPIFDSYNPFLQSPEPLVLVLHRTTQSLQKSLLSRFVDTEVLSAAESNLDSFEINLEVDLKPLSSVFIGMITRQYAKYDYLISTSLYRSSRSQIFFKIGVLKNFAIFTEKTCVGVYLIRPECLQLY